MNKLTNFNLSYTLNAEPDGRERAVKVEALDPNDAIARFKLCRGSGYLVKEIKPSPDVAISFVPYISDMVYKDIASANELRYKTIRDEIGERVSNGKFFVGNVTKDLLPYIKDEEIRNSISDERPLRLDEVNWDNYLSDYVNEPDLSKMLSGLMITKDENGYKSTYWFDKNGLMKTSRLVVSGD